MSFAGVSQAAVILAAATSFLFGGIWYGMLSGPWMAAANINPARIQGHGKGGGAILAPYVIAFLGQLVMAFFLAGLLAHLGAGQVTIKNGLLAAASVWAGFVIAPMAVNHAFQGAKPALTLIDGGHWLGVLLLQGAIIGWMGAN